MPREKARETQEPVRTGGEVAVEVSFDEYLPLDDTRGRCYLKVIAMGDGIGSIHENDIHP